MKLAIKYVWISVKKNGQKLPVAAANACCNALSASLSRSHHLDGVITKCVDNIL